MASWILIPLMAVIAAWCVSLAAPRYGVRALAVATLVSLLPLLLGRFHLSFVPILLALAAAWGYHRRRESGKKGLASSVIVGSALLLFMAGGLVYALPFFRIGNPTGPYTVGTRALLLDDRLPAQLWYPAASTTKNAPYFLDGSPLIAEVAAIFGVPRPVLSHFHRITTPAQLDAPVSEAEASYPILIFSHGLGGFRAQNTVQMLELASYGYVVLSVDHPGYAAAAVIHGEVHRNRHRELVGAGVEVLDEHIGEWVSNLGHALDALPQIARALDNRIDPSRIGAFGHSFGGSAAQRLLLTDPRVLAAINMDGGTFGEPLPTSKPFLYMSSNSTLDFESFSNRLEEFSDTRIVEMTGRSRDELEGNFLELLRRRAASLDAGAYSMVIEDISHIGFTDAVLYSPLLADADGVHRAINEVSLAFFDRYVRNRPDSPELSELAARHPTVDLRRHDP